MSKLGETGAAFKEAYASLNAAQKQAVDTIEGPVMVIAGPGTGKTQILTLRIANILLKTDSKPENILALTFTESGAKAMRERLVRYIGAEAYRVAIFTFHSFAQRLIAAYPDAYPDIIGGKPASDIDKISIIETILDSGAVETLRPGGNPQYYVKPVQSMLSDLKREYITPDRLAELITHDEELLAGIEQIHQTGAHKGKVRGEYKDKEKAIEKNRALLTVYRQYQALLRERKLFDFDDMIVETVGALEKNEDMLRDLQESYQYILADEHQDVNGSQNKILELLASYHQSPNIFVVGDEKQAIFRFQGASLDNFLYFSEYFKDTVVISLIDNYRSGQPILDAAQSLIAVADGPLKDLRVPLKAAAIKNASVERRSFSHQAVEDEWVVATIQEVIGKGTLAEEVAVIARSNREVEGLTEALRASGVAASASADSDILHHPITHTVEQLMQAVVSTDAAALFTVLHGSYWGIDRTDLVKLFSSQSYSQSLLLLITDTELLASLQLSKPEALDRVNEVLNEARMRSLTEAPHQVLAYVVEASGLKNHLMTQDPLSGTRVLRRLYDEIEAMVRSNNAATLSDVAAMLKQRREYNLPLNAPFIATDTGVVQVMTAHKSKGLEFTVVIAPHLTDNAWGGKVRRDNFKITLPRQLKESATDATDDERRLLYVMMTRAKERLLLSSSEMSSDGKPLTPSRLFADIEDGLLPVIDTMSEEDQFDPMVSIRTTVTPAVVDPVFIKTLFAARGFSATSLNNYLRSPWDFYYRNLLRIPEVQPVHMQFGTAVHNVMQYVTTMHMKEQKLPSDSVIKEQLERQLARLPVGVEDYTRLHKKGLEALLTYIPQVAPHWSKQTFEELAVNVLLETGIPELPHLPLTGKLDRLDVADDGTVLRVVDYKTGKPKSRNVIEGKTKTADGAYKRQLVFYALLLDLYDDKRYRCREGVLSFVEADAKGVVHEESFTITNEEIIALKDEIISATKEIISGQFLTVPCDPEQSSYCHLVELLK